MKTLMNFIDYAPKDINLAELAKGEQIEKIWKEDANFITPEVINYANNLDKSYDVNKHGKGDFNFAYEELNRINEDIDKDTEQDNEKINIKY